jgi:hypothetical protein
VITFLLHGKFTPQFWQALREDPEVAPVEIGRIAMRVRCGVERFFYAIDEHDFYATLCGETVEELAMARHLLMASGLFKLLHAEQLFTFAEMFPNGTPAMAGGKADR